MSDLRRILDAWRETDGYMISEEMADALQQAEDNLKNEGCTCTGGRPCYTCSTIGGTEDE